MINAADIVVGLAWGDEAKGKVTSHLASLKKDGAPYYDFVARWNGGSNAGHTIYVNDVCFKTHIVPCGILHGIKSIIGPNCVLNPDSFYRELDALGSKGADTSLVRVSPRCHIVSEQHIEYDRLNLSKKLGTTSKGIAPCYADKAARTGVLARDVLDEELLWDENLYGNLLCEGAQGVWLDINRGRYPWVTSSETLPYSACSIGFPTQVINNIYGAAKIYDTRSGEDPMFPSLLFDDRHLKQIADVGAEYGVTTGRRRKVNWLNLNYLIESINLTGTTSLLISKCDILEEVGVYRLFYNEELLTFVSLVDMKSFIKTSINNDCPLVEKIGFSYSAKCLGQE
tara:strand:+ start:23625 stop:24647 length:1023 start_codon:yes stop_codon:yes gene_type:complete